MIKCSVLLLTIERVEIVLKAGAYFYVNQSLPQLLVSFLWR